MFSSSAAGLRIRRSLEQRWIQPHLLHRLVRLLDLQRLGAAEAGRTERPEAGAPGRADGQRTLFDGLLVATLAKAAGSHLLRLRRPRRGAASDLKERIWLIPQSIAEVKEKSIHPTSLGSSCRFWSQHGKSSLSCGGHQEHNMCHHNVDRIQYASHSRQS